MKKRIVSVFLAVILAVSILPGNVQQKFGIQKEVEAETALQNPQIVEDSSMAAGQKVTWDCVWFGSYPQTEIVDKPEMCGAYGKEWKEDSEFEVDVSLYNILKDATGWSNSGDLILNGVRYRRLKSSNATLVASGETGYYNWNNTETYHYFRYDPIKWRVLDTDGSKALLLADKGLDNHKYHTEVTSITWENSSMRSFLNDSFYGTAFTAEEQNSILTSSLSNDDNMEFNTEGGNDTSDKVFLLSEKECDGNYSKNYGFVENEDNSDEAKRCNPSTYAKAMGAWWNWTNTELAGTCVWTLRTPGEHSYDVCHISKLGGIIGSGDYVDCLNATTRPALRLDLSSNCYSYAGTVSSDEAKHIFRKYIIGRDNWSFQNRPTGKIKYSDCKKLFADKYTELYAKSIYINNTEFKGACFGFSMLIPCILERNQPVSSKIKHIHDYEDNEIKTWLNLAQLYQKAQNILFEASQNKGKLNELYETVKEEVYNDGKPVVILLNKQHAVLATDIVKDTPEEVIIGIYDPNYLDNYHFTLFRSVRLYGKNGIYDKCELGTSKTERGEFSWQDKEEKEYYEHLEETVSFTVSYLDDFADIAQTIKNSYVTKDDDSNYNDYALLNCISGSLVSSQRKYEDASWNDSDDTESGEKNSNNLVWAENTGQPYVLSDVNDEVSLTLGNKSISINPNANSDVKISSQGDGNLKVEINSDTKGDVVCNYLEGQSDGKTLVTDIIMQGDKDKIVSFNSKGMEVEGVTDLSIEQQKGDFDDDAQLIGEKVLSKTVQDINGKTQVEIVRDEKTNPDEQSCEHSFSKSYTVDKAATCTNTGSESIHCTKCGEIKPGSSRSIPKAAHKFGVWTTIIVPITNKVAGKIRTCSVCGFVQVASVAQTNKSEQPMTVKAIKKSVKFSKVKKKKQVVKAITVKNAQGTVTYKITGGNKKSKKALKVNTKNGKITVKKKTKKGTYKIKVTVTAAGNTQYKAGSKTVDVSIMVK